MMQSGYECLFPHISYSEVSNSTKSVQYPKLSNSRLFLQHLEERGEELGPINVPRCNTQRINISS